MNPQGRGGAFAPVPGDDEHQDDEDSPCHPRARTRQEPETLTGPQAPGKPELSRKTAVGHPARDDLLSGRSVGQRRRVTISSCDLGDRLRLCEVPTENESA